MTVTTRLTGRARKAALASLILLSWAGVALAHDRDQGKGKDKDCSREVLVVNGATQPVPVRVLAEPPLQPFQQQVSLDWADGQDFTQASFQVPAGKMLVMEYVSTAAYLPPTGQSLFVRITTSASLNGASHNIALQKTEDQGVLKSFEAAHVVRIYANAGSTVTVSAGRFPFSDTASGFLTISGRLVDVP